MTNDKQQTAVEWLVDRTGRLRFVSSDIYYEAKKYEIKRMFKIYHEYQDYLDYEFKNQQGGQGVILTFEQYYNETYGGNK